MFNSLRTRKLRLYRSRPTTLALEPLEGRWVPSASAWHDLEPNDTPSLAQIVSPLSPLDQAQIAGTIESATDVDWYRFDLLERSQVAFQLSGVGTVSLFQTDPQDASRLVPLASDQVLQAGSYLVAISSGIAGDYELSVDVVPPPVAAGSPIDVGRLLPADLVNGVAIHRDNVVGDAEYLQFTVTEQNVYLIALSNAAGAPVARVALADADGRTLTPSFTTSDRNFHTLILFLDPGSYHLKVSGWDASAAGEVSYTLRFSARLQENPTPLTTAPAPAYRLRLTTGSDSVGPASPGAPSPSPLLPRTEPAPLSIAQTPRLVMPNADGAEAVRFASTVRLSGTLGGDLPRPSGATTGLSAGPVGVAVGTNATASGPLRLRLPTEEFAGIDSRGSLAHEDRSRDPMFPSASLAWASETVSHFVRMSAFQSIYWLNLPMLEPHTDAFVVLPASEFSPDVPVSAIAPAVELPILEVAMPASPSSMSARGATMSSWLTLGLFAGAGGLLLFAQDSERRRGSPSLAETRCESR